jgi:hypothetical protein
MDWIWDWREEREKAGGERAPRGRRGKINDDK